MSLTITPTVSSPRWAAARWLRHGWRELLCHARKRWYLYALLLAVWVLAFVRLFVAHMPVVPIVFNTTASLPYTLAYVDYGSTAPLVRGDYVIFAFDGPATATHPGLKGQPFFKRIAGMPGDVVTVVDRRVFVNRMPVGLAKRFARDGTPLEPIVQTVIPPDHYYVAGTDADSFDSRYAISGLVPAGQIANRVVPIF